MGYRIDYTDRTKRSYSAEEKRPFPWRILGIFLIVFVILFNFLYPGGREMLDLILWPGDKVQTLSALERMVQELGTGKTVVAVIGNFCREILNGEALALS